MNRLLHLNGKIYFGLLVWIGILYIGFSTYAQNPCVPYNIVMNIYDDPKTKMAFNWFTDDCNGCGKVQVVIGETTNPSTFTNPFKEVIADCTENNLINKVVVTGLSPNTTYSFRVGGVNGNWSNIGKFTTAKDNKEPFSFIYITDTQVGEIEFGDLKTRTDMVASNHENANFWLHCGDLIWTGSNQNEWNDYFTSQQAMFYRFPFAPVLGNHELYSIINNNFSRHFNTEDFGSTDPHKSTYTYTYGDAQFFAINSELWDKPAYLTALSTWMRSEVNAHQDITWRIVYFHRSTYTAAGELQNDLPTTQWRKTITPLLEKFDIDLVLFGHDHVYQVIGPVLNNDTVPGAVSNVQPATQHDSINATGKSGGTFNVKEGTLYFCNGTFGTHLFYPMPFGSMPGINNDIPDYPSLFTGMLGQTGNPTYSNVSVSTDNIIISTYEIDNGNSMLLDEIKVVKYCEPYTQAKVIYNSTQSFTNKTLIIGEELRITNNATVTFTNSTLRFYKNARVVIEPGSKLIIDSTILTNSCDDKMWYGIFVSGNKWQQQTPQYQGVLELKNGAVIENAIEAISTWDGANYNTSGGIVQATDATFKNNGRSVNFIEYSGGANPVPQNISHFTNCTFIVNNTNLFAKNNTAFENHIKMSKVNGVHIKGCTFENNITNMPDRKHAIYTEDAGYTVSDHCTSFNVLQCKCTGISTPSTFKGFNTAIESVNSTNPYAIRIERSMFQNNIAAISMSAKNTFRIFDTEISLANSYSNHPKGIYLNNCTNYRIEGNKIYSNGANISRGIFVAGSVKDENKIYRNHIYQTEYGIQVGDYCKFQLEEQEDPPVEDPFNRGLPGTGLQLLCNDLEQNSYDIYVCNNGEIRTVQGSSDKGADNLFSHIPPAIFNFYIESSTATVDYYYDSSIPRKNPANKTNNVISHNYATASLCENTVCLEEGPNVKTGGGEFSRFTSSSSSLDTYRELKNIYSKMMNIFYANGYDIILQDYYSGLIEYSELVGTAMAYHEAILAVTEDMAEISHTALFQLKTDSLIDLTKIRDWYDEIYTLSAKYSLAETYYQLGEYENGFSALLQIPINYNLTEKERIEHNNYVSLYSFKNSIRESGRAIAELTEVEIEQLVSFAKASQGLSSVMAKGTLCFYYDICMEDELRLRSVTEGDDEMMRRLGDEMIRGLDDEVIRGLDDERMRGLDDEMMRGLDDEMMKKSPSNIEGVDDEVGRGSLYEKITLVPNPTTGELKIENGELKIENVEVFDVYGRKLLSNHLITSSSNHLINISHLHSGIYFVKITTEAGEVVKKVVKQ